MRFKKSLNSPKKHLRTHEKLQDAIEQNADGIIITDDNGIIEYVNNTLLLKTGYSFDELIGKSPSIFKSGRHDEKFYKDLWLTITSGNPFRKNIINKKKNGDLMHVVQTITPIIDDRGIVTHYVSVWKEKVDHLLEEENLKILMETLKIEREKLRQVLNMEKNLNTIKNIDKLIDYIVYETAQILGVSRCSLMFLDKNTEQLCIKGHYGLNEDKIDCCRIPLGQPVVGQVAQMDGVVVVNDIEHDKRFMIKNRAGYKNKSFMSSPIKLDEELMGVLNVSEKISCHEKMFTELDEKIMLMIVSQIAATIGLSKLYREFNYYNTQDSLTNLFNYHHFTRTLDYEIKRLKTFSGFLALLRVDVDDYMEFMRKYGERDAENLLKEIAGIITLNLRDVDIACRYAGDEFIIILPEAGIETARYIALKVKNEILALNKNQPVTVTMGIANYKKGMERHDLISRVNTALYNAKKEGKNRIGIF